VWGGKIEDRSGLLGMELVLVREKGRADTGKL